MSAPLPPRPDLAEAPIDARGVQPVTWRWWEVVIVGVLGIVVASIVVIPLFDAADQDPTEAVGTTGLVLSAIFAVVWVGAFLAWLSWFHRGWRSMLGWPRAGRVARELSIGVGLGVLLYIGSNIVGYAISVVLRAASGDPIEPPVQVEAPADLTGAVVLVLVAVVVAAIAEEFIFRGLLFRSIADRHGFWTGAIMSAIPFGLVHAAVGTDLAVWGLRATLVVVGVGLAWIYRRRRNLLAAVAAHAAFNAIGVATILLVGAG